MRWYGSSRLRYNHYPVHLASSTRLQLEWNVVPKANAFLNAMSRRTNVLTSIKVSQDYADLETSSREERKSRLLELAETGDKMAAVKIARALYSFNLKEAKEFVEGLVGGKTTRGGSPDSTAAKRRG
jgi:ribosomal protein L7/L12